MANLGDNRSRDTMEEVAEAERRKDWPVVLQLSRQCLVEDVANTQALMSAAKACSYMGKADESIELMFEANKINRFERQDVFDLLFKLLIHAGRLNEAIDLLKAKVDKVPQNQMKCGSCLICSWSTNGVMKLQIIFVFL